MTGAGLLFPLTIHSEDSKAMQMHEITLEPLAVEPTTIDKIKEAVVTIAYKYGVENSQLIQTLKCESGFDNTRVGKAGEIGIAQFMPSTWALWNKQRGINLNIHSIRDQLDMMSWAFKNHLEPNWTCWKIYFTH